MSSALPSNLIRTDFWFNDGNIVLIAQSAAFKVHKGQLARHSEVFSDLFLLPQPPSIPSQSSSGGSPREDWDLEKEKEHLIDGCPFVILQDSPSDVFYFLGALYDGLYFTPPKPNSRPYPPSFPCLSAVLRLSTKYLVEPLVQQCLFHLCLDWPTSLSAWDDREAKFTLDPPSPPTPSSPSSPSKNPGKRHLKGRYIPRQFCPHPILVIQFAQEMNIPEILPAAMYDLSRYGPTKIMNGAAIPPTLFDRWVAKLTSGLDPTASSPAREWERPKHIRLSRELLCQILRGREEVQRYLASFLEDLYSRPPSPSCQNAPSIPTTPPTQTTGTPSYPSTPPDPSPIYPVQTPNNPCSDSFYYILLNTVRSVGGISVGRDADTLFTLTQAAEMLDRTDFYVPGAAAAAGSEDGTVPDRRTFGLNLCYACKREFRERVRKAREELWSCLPRWFGLEAEAEAEGEPGVGWDVPGK